MLAPAGAVAGADVRGGAPGTLGTDALRPGMLVQEAHAILLTGGSAFGLDAAAGVMAHLEQGGHGLAIGPVRVPIVAGAVIFDLLTSDASARPGAAAGTAACRAATREPAVGAVGAGTGATVAKAAGAAGTAPGGFGLAGARAGDATVAAAMVANGVGGVWDDERHTWIAPLAGWDHASGLMPGANTTIGVVVTDARLTKEQANRVATVAHDGIARAVRPAHTRYDGDTMFCLATGAVDAPADAVEAVAAQVVAAAIAAGVRAAGAA
ncbi:P1 family peptidase [Baekduia soli]|uniref:P1 family peptidase n=1 Tax=Baekduia soli TaxID=496014 RepID=UPI002AA2ACA3|nr:P1 family peptidase [Baekduia soli]